MKTVLISGGSRGIGRATAIRMAAQGWQVALTYRSDAAAADETTSAIESAGGTAISILADTVSEADVLKAFDTTIERLGSVSAVIVNAGVVAPPLPLADMDLDRFETVLNTNVLGAFLFAREAARRLPGQGQAEDRSIVFVSSAAARLGSPNEYVDYAASKAALDTLTIGLSKELGPEGVRVNAVRPGLIDTDIHASGGQPDRAERLGRTTPLGRAGSADEVASTIAWLCSEEASYCTGAILDVTGGR